jgi:hypothetical protein
MVLKSASTAEFVTFSATTETPPQNQRKMGSFEQLRTKEESLQNIAL